MYFSMNSVKVNKCSKVTFQVGGFARHTEILLLTVGFCSPDNLSEIVHELPLPA